jgi:amino acid adenylation domain-containing protein
MGLSMQNIGTRIASLSAEQRQLLQHMLRESSAEKKASAAQIPALQRVDGQPTRPMSFAQQRMWFIDQLQPGNCLYNEHGQLHFVGTLDIPALQRSLEEIVRRHEALRTTFTSLMGAPVQFIAPRAHVHLPIIDLEGLPPEKQESELRRLATQEAHTPFDLAAGPLTRVSLIRFGAEDHYAFITMHQIISDGWSVWVFTREVAEVYAAFSTGKPSPLPELRIQYSDFAEWQRGLRDDISRRELQYWKKQLEGCYPYLDLPFDRPHSHVKNFDGANQPLRLSQSLSDAIKQFSRNESVTPFVVMIAAFKILLNRYTRQTDIAVSVPVAGRNHVDLESLIGFFVNVLVLRTDLSGAPSFRELVRRFNEAAVGAYAHQDLPYDKLIEELAPERSLQRTPFFDILVNFNNLPRIPLTLPDLSITRHDLHEPKAKFPITLYVDDARGFFELRMLYQSELFSRRRIETMLEQFSWLLEQVVVSPDQSIDSYSLVTSEMEKVLPDPRIHLEKPGYQPIPEIFLSLARSQPDAPALRQGNITLSYAEMAERAGRVAKGLIAQGLNKGDTVAVTGVRSPGLVVAMMGTLLAGGVLLTLDPNLPEKRRNVMLKEANARALVLADLARAEGATAGDGIPAKVLRISPVNGLLEETAGRKDEDIPLPAIHPEDSAYIFFTSGTTAVPKGVLGTHSGLSHFLAWQRTEFKITPSNRCAQLTHLSFDVLLRDVFLPLTSGASLWLLKDPEDLAVNSVLPWLQQCAISVIHTTPSIAQSWCAHAATQLALPALRWIFFAGEPLTAALIEAWRENFPGPAQIINLYGPTETTLAKCFYRVDQEKFMPQVQPVGFAIPFTQALVLSERQRLCGPGEAGEIVIRTPFRSRGYINQKTENASKFIPNPFRDGADDTEDLLYRTGDLGRYRMDGALEILGRMDHEVKIRGVRIHPDEIAMALLQHPAVEACVVDVRKSPENEKFLAAYVIPRQGMAADPEDLRSYLASQLPAAMVPSAFALMEKFPLTPTGKINRLALPDVTSAAAARGMHHAGIGPRTPTETTIAEIWGRKLKVPEVDIHANFFSLGGHSLLAIEIMQEIRDAFRLDIPLRTLFESPTIAGLSGKIQNMLASGQTRPVLNLSAIIPDAVDRYQPFPLTDIQQAYWLGRSSNFELGNIATHNYSEFEFTDLDFERFSAAFQRLIQRHDMLRAVVSSSGEQKILKEVQPYQIKFQDLREMTAADAQAAIEQVRRTLSHQVLPLDQWPLFEVRISRLDERRFVIHMSIDALICDAWSRRTLGRELLLMYQNPEVKLAPLELSFRDCVLAERKLRAAQEYKEAEQFWRSRLEDLPPAPQLPLAVSPASLSQPRFIRRRMKLEAPVWSRLKARAAEAGLTPSGLICAVYAEILGLWSSSQRFTLNLTIFNRSPLHPQMNSIVGDFTSLILLPVNNEERRSFAERARAIQKELWSCLDHSAFTGIQVLRELNRKAGGPATVLMPIVLTSTLVDERNQHDDLLAVWQEDMRYGISQTPQVYLDHGVSEQSGALVFGWDVVEDLFPPGMVEEMFQSYQLLLQRLSGDEQVWQQESRAWLLPAAQLERRARANQTQAPAPPGLLHAPFLAQAAQHPERPAILTAEISLNYAQLLALARHYAAQLRRLQVQPNQLVAIVMEKGWEQLAAALAILESGAAYLPIDASLPQQRRDQLLALGEARVALTQPWLLDKLAWPSSLHKLAVTPLSHEQQQTALSQPATAPAQQPEDLAYVIFTSGSTGVPKGVMIAHRAALNTVLDINQRFAVSDRDRVLALSSMSFDLSVYDVFGLLAAGGAVVIPPPDSMRDPAAWLRLIEQHSVTLWNTVPALMEMLAEYAAGQPGACLPSSLRLAMLSGDWIPLSLPPRLWSLAAALEIISLGGATEASIWSIFHPIKTIAPEWKSIPYGQPLLNQQFHVLNTALEPAPEWVPGDLYIGGLGLAEGYWRDPEKTAAAFIRHPVTGERLYRTGDLGRYMPDGGIEFLGRKDSQIKLHGHRIELGEIEAVLQQHPEVRDAVATLFQHSNGTRQIAAYVVMKAGSSLEENALRAFLRQKLPEYMVPASMCMLESLPLTSNGKIDRKSLPHPEVSSRPASSSAPGPQTTVEELVFTCCCQVLKRDQISMEDNFFELGGDSVAGVQLITHLQSIFQIELPLRTLFESPTARDLASAIERRKLKSHKLEAAPVQAVVRGAEMPLSFVQERFWFLSQIPSQSYFYNIPVAIRIAGDVDIPRLHKALHRLAQRHEILRTSFPSRRGKAIAVIAPELKMEFPQAPLECASLEEAIAFANQDGMQPFNMEKGPLFRIHLLRIGADDHLLVLTIHHIICDARSAELMMEELAAEYQALQQGEQPQATAFTLQYVDFAHWQQESLRAGRMEGQRDYWKKHLELPLPSLQFRRTARRRGQSAQAFAGARHHFRLLAELSQALRTISQNSGCTLFMTMLAAYYVLLHQSSGQEDIIVSTSVSNRGQSGTERMMGCFLNTLLLRIKARPDLGFRDCQARVRETFLNAAGNSDLPLEEVIKTVAPDRSSSHSPVSSVAFGLRNSHTRDITVSGLTFTAIDLERHLAKFDLELQLVNKPEGILGYFDYDTSLFDADAVAELEQSFRAILSRIVQAPEAKMKDLFDAPSPESNGKPASQKKTGGLRNIKPQAITVSRENLVKKSVLVEKWGMPLVVQPNVPALDLLQWTGNNKDFISQELPRMGAILFRDFSVPSVEYFQKVTQALSSNLMEYKERSTPRSQVKDKVYTSTEYPADQWIPLHNENSYAHSFPRKIWFFCAEPAREGGETPLADSRRVFEAVPEDIRRNFEKKGVMYIRNYRQELGLSWQESFQTSDAAQVEDYCRNAGMEFEWISGTHLRTRHVRPGIAVHPITGERVWFNQAHLFHESNLGETVRKSIAAIYSANDLPRSVCYGDGSPLEEEALRAIREAYQNAQFSFPWQKDDVLLLDNILVAHGRAPYTGPRRILVAMSDPATSAASATA